MFELHILAVVAFSCSHALAVRSCNNATAAQPILRVPTAEHDAQFLTESASGQTVQVEVYGVVDIRRHTST